MDRRAAALIAALGLLPHPEGGYYREVFRSRASVQPGDERGARAALTTIYFLLVEGQVSRWHQVASDEVWHFYEGGPLELFWLEPEGMSYHRALLAPVSQGEEEARPAAVVPAGAFQAARPTGAYTLVGCTVGPGFDFEDFLLLDAERTRAIGQRFPELADLE